jgi:uncharacterized membrane protein YobD (UPF0266 family)
MKERVLKPRFTRLLNNYLFHFAGKLLLSACIFLGYFSVVMHVSKTNDAPAVTAALLAGLFLLVLFVAVEPIYRVVIKNRMTFVLNPEGIRIYCGKRLVRSFKSEEYSFDAQLNVMTARGFTFTQKHLNVYCRKTGKQQRINLVGINKEDYYNQLHEFLPTINRQGKTETKHDPVSYPYTYYLHKNELIESVQSTSQKICLITLLVTVSLVAGSMWFLFFIINQGTNMLSIILLIVFALIFLAVGIYVFFIRLSLNRKILLIPERVTLNKNSISVDDRIFPAPSVRSIELTSPYSGIRELECTITARDDTTDYSFIVDIWTKSGFHSNYPEIYHAIQAWMQEQLIGESPEIFRYNRSGTRRTVRMKKS